METGSERKEGGEDSKRNITRPLTTSDVVHWPCDAGKEEEKWEEGEV